MRNNLNLILGPIIRGVLKLVNWGVRKARSIIILNQKGCQCYVVILPPVFLQQLQILLTLKLSASLVFHCTSLQYWVHSCGKLNVQDTLLFMKWTYRIQTKVVRMFQIYCVYCLIFLWFLVSFFINYTFIFCNLTWSICFKPYDWRISMTKTLSGLF